MSLSGKRQEAAEAEESFTPRATSQTFLCRGSPYLVAGNREAIWSKDLDKGCCPAGQLESCWFVWQDDHVRSEPG